MALIEAGDFERALAIFYEAIQLQPRSAEAHYGLGVALSKNEDNRLVDLGKHSGRAAFRDKMTELGLLPLRDDHLNDAFRYFKGLADHNDTITRNTMAVFMAIEPLEISVRLNPSYVEAKLALAATYSATAAHRAAIAIYTALLGEGATHTSRIWLMHAIESELDKINNLHSAEITRLTSEIPSRNISSMERISDKIRSFAIDYLRLPPNLAQRALEEAAELVRQEITGRAPAEPSPPPSGNMFSDVPLALRAKEYEKGGFPPELLNDADAVRAARRIVSARNRRKEVTLTDEEAALVRRANRFVRAAERHQKRLGSSQPS